MYKTVAAAFGLAAIVFASAGDLLLFSLLAVVGLIWAATTPVFRTLSDVDPHQPPAARIE